MLNHVMKYRILNNTYLLKEINFSINKLKHENELIKLILPNCSYLHRNLSLSYTCCDKKTTPKELLDEAISMEADIHTQQHGLWHSDPYTTERAHFKKKISEAANKLYEAQEDVKDLNIILFPGQGTQYVGMGKNLMQYPNVEDMFEAASEILGYNLHSLCMNGPIEELTKTVNQQPAIFVTSMAAVEKLNHENPVVLENCYASAGFSVGELTSLTFAGAFSFEDGVRLIKARAEAMQIASELADSGMVTVHYGSDSKLSTAIKFANEYCQLKGIQFVECAVANYLYPSCKVVAGNTEALDFIIENKDDFKLRKVTKIPVSGAFHTSFMNAAKDTFSEVLKEVLVREPVIPVYSNFGCRKYTDANSVRKILPKQMVNPVKWEQIMQNLYKRREGKSFPNTYICGPGKNLKFLLKMVNAKAHIYTRVVNE